MHHPRTLEQVREITHAFLIHYNAERPNQALSCGNQPPYVAFPALLPCLPPLPTLVDPDAWLTHVHGQHFVRQVRANGTVRIAEGSYYVHLNRIGQYVDLCVDAPRQVFVVYSQQHVLKQVPIKGLQKTLLPFESLPHSCVSKPSPNTAVYCKPNRRLPRQHCRRSRPSFFSERRR